MWLYIRKRITVYDWKPIKNINSTVTKKTAGAEKNLNRLGTVILVFIIQEDTWHLDRKAAVFLSKPYCARYSSWNDNQDARHHITINNNCTGEHYKAGLRFEARRR